MTSPTDINVPTRALLDAETKACFVRWLANLNLAYTVDSNQNQFPLDFRHTFTAILPLVTPSITRTFR